MHKMNVYSPSDLEQVVKTLGTLLVPDGEPRKRFQDANDYQRLLMIERQVRLRLEEIRQLRRGDFTSDEALQHTMTAAASDDPHEAAKAQKELVGRNLNQSQVRVMLAQLKTIRRRAGAAAVGLANLHDKGLVKTASNSAGHDLALVIDQLVEVAGQPDLSELRRYLKKHEDPQEVVDALEAAMGAADGGS